MYVNKFVMLLLLLFSFLAESSSVAFEKNSTVDGEICEQLMLETRKQTDLNVEKDYHLITKENLVSKPETLNQILSEREQLVEYQREFI